MTGPIIPLPALQPINLKSRWAARQWQLLHDWTISMPLWGNITIPKGFIFDGASVPRTLWGLFSPTGVLFTASIVHDFAIEHRFLWVEGSKLPMTDGDSDELFHQISRYLGFNATGAMLSYLGVRLGSLFRSR